MKNILVKISGELLGTKQENGQQLFNYDNVLGIAKLILGLKERLGCQVYVVVGGGNIVRGRELEQFKFEDGEADHIGMASTLLNALMLKKMLCRIGQKAHVMTPTGYPSLELHPYEAGKAKWWTGKGHIIIFGGGTGRCGFTTDMAAVSYAYEVGVKFVVKVTEVGGLFTADPKKDPQATIIPHIGYQEVLDKQYEVMDLEAFAFAKRNSISIKIMKLEDLEQPDLADTSFGSLIGG
ncbi:MAG: uridylate kinase [Patescibacteria group bacterium]|nr:uridylate kinase [Patescibacteria group bacterium]